MKLWFLNKILRIFNKNMIVNIHFREWKDSLSNRTKPTLLDASWTPLTHVTILNIFNLHQVLKETKTWSISGGVLFDKTRKRISCPRAWAVRYEDVRESEVKLHSFQISPSEGRHWSARDSGDRASSRRLREPQNRSARDGEKTDLCPCQRLKPGHPFLGMRFAGSAIPVETLSRTYAHTHAYTRALYAAGNWMN